MTPNYIIINIFRFFLIKILNIKLLLKSFLGKIRQLVKQILKTQNIKKTKADLVLNSIIFF